MSGGSPLCKTARGFDDINSYTMRSCALDQQYPVQHPNDHDVSNSKTPLFLVIWLARFHGNDCLKSYADYV